MATPPARALSLGITYLPTPLRERMQAALGRPVRWHDEVSLEPLLERSEEVRELFVSLPVELDAATLARMPRLRYVGVLGTSVSNVDMQAARAAGIEVTNVQHYCDPETAEFTTGLIVGGLRGIFVENPGALSLSESRVGVVGLGQVGSIVAEQLEQLGVEVIPFRRADGDRSERLRGCHAVSIHGPRDVQVFGPEDFAHLSPGAGLVNTSNGRLVDEPAFTRWFEKGRGWVALDAVAARNYGHLRTLAPERFFVSPRHAYRTPSAVARRDEQFVANLERYLAAVSSPE